MPRNFLVRAAAGVAVSIVALWLVLRSVDLQETADVLRTADWRWIAALAVFLCIDLAVRTLRWQRLLAPIAAVPYRHTLGYLLAGYLANNVLPARLGELVRSHYVGDREGISRSTTLGTVVVERVVDLVAVVAIASVAILVLSVRGIVASAVLAGVAVAGLLAVGLAIGIAAHRLPGAEGIATWAERYPRVREAVARLRDGLRVAGRPRTLVEALLLSAIAWGATILAFAAAGQSVGVQLTIGQAALLASGVALASAIPAGPANLGTFELAAVEIGKAIGVSSSEAFAIGLIAHVSILVVTSIGGIAALCVAELAAPGRRVRARARDDDDAATLTRPRIRRAPGRPAEGSSAVARDARGASAAMARYLTRPWALSQAVATSLMSFLSTATCLYRSASVAVSILADTSSRSFWNAALSVLARVVADDRRDVVGRLRLLVVLEPDPAVDDDLGPRRAELGDVDGLAFERVGHRRAAGVEERHVQRRDVDAVGVLQRPGADRVRRAVRREAPLELRPRPPSGRSSW